MEQWRAALLAARLDTSWNGTVLQVPFDGQQPGTNATLRRLVELEGSRCSFLTWSLAEQGAAALLTVKARKLRGCRRGRACGGPYSRHDL